MPEAIDPRRTADDFIDWLRIKPDPGHESSSSSDESDDNVHTTQTLKRVDNRPAGRVVWCVIGMGVGFILTSCFMPRTSNEATPAPAVTVTKQVVREVQVKSELPKPCTKALAAMQKYLDSAAKITSANNAQIDIMSDAYQAIMMKDWKRLNEIEVRQRQLEHTLSDPTVQLMEPYKQVKSELDQCLALIGPPQTTDGTR